MKNVMLNLEITVTINCNIPWTGTASPGELLEAGERHDLIVDNLNLKGLRLDHWHRGRLLGYVPAEFYGYQTVRVKEGKE